MTDVAPATARACPRCRRVTQPRDGRAPRYCATCGQRLEPAPTHVTHQFAPAAPATGKAIAALILGLLGLVPVCGLPLGLIAIALGIDARRRSVANPRQAGGGGLAAAGIVLGIIGLGIQVLFCAGAR